MGYLANVYATLLSPRTGEAPKKHLAVESGENPQGARREALSYKATDLIGFRF